MFSFKIRKKLSKVWRKSKETPSTTILTTLAILFIINLFGYYSLYSFRTTFPPVDVVNSLHNDQIRNQSTIIQEVLVDSYLRHQDYYLDHRGNLTIIVQPSLKLSRQYSLIEFVDGFVNFENLQHTLTTQPYNSNIGTLLRMDFPFNPFNLTKIHDLGPFTNQINFLYPMNFNIKSYSDLWYLLHVSNFIILICSMVLIVSLCLIWIENWISQYIFVGFLGFSGFSIMGLQFFQMVLLIMYEVKLHNQKFVKKFLLLLVIFIINCINSYCVAMKIIDSAEHDDEPMFQDTDIQEQPSNKTVPSTPISIPHRAFGGLPRGSPKLTHHKYPSSVYGDSFFNEHLEGEDTESIHSHVFQFSVPNKSAVTLDPNDIPDLIQPRPVSSRSVIYSGPIRNPTSANAPMYKSLTAPVPVISMSPLSGSPHKSPAVSPETDSSGFEQVKGILKNEENTDDLTLTRVSARVEPDPNEGDDF